jgi:long-chain fatty acid transport protein
VDNPPRCLPAALAVAALSFGLHEQATAAGFQLRENSASALGTAYAGAAATADDPSIIASNPAGMILLRESQISTDVSIAIPSAVFSGSGVTALGQPISGGNGGNPGRVRAIPAAFGFYDAMPDLKFGIGITAPFALNSQYNRDWVGRYSTIKSVLEPINVNPNFAYRILDWFSIGAGFAVQHIYTELTNSINSTTVARSANSSLPAGFALPDGSVKLTGISLAVGYTLGVLAEASSETRFGASLRTRVRQHIEGSAGFDVPAPLSAIGAFQNTPVQADFTTPDVVTLAAHHEVSPGITLLAEGQWTNWSEFKRLRIERPDGSIVSDQPQHWHGTWFTSVGASYRPTPNWTIRSGLGIDPSPIPLQFRGVRPVDADRYWLAGGIGYRLSPTLSLDFAYAHIFYKNKPVRDVSQTGDVLTGQHSSQLDIIKLSLTHGF